jgi:hypothetical protein
MAEVAAALSRTGSAAALAQQYALAIGQLPNTVLVALDEDLARQAAALGAQHKLRGADSVFLASAALFAAELVTLDREQLQRGSSIVQTLSPADFLRTAFSIASCTEIGSRSIDWDGERAAISADLVDQLSTRLAAAKS